jgi:hypothetical protein
MSDVESRYKAICKHDDLIVIVDDPERSFIVAVARDEDRGFVLCSTHAKPVILISVKPGACDWSIDDSSRIATCPPWMAAEAVMFGLAAAGRILEEEGNS